MILSRVHNYSGEPRFKFIFFLSLTPLSFGRVTCNHFDLGNGRNTDYTHRTITGLAISGRQVFPIITLHLTKGSLISEGLLQLLTSMVYIPDFSGYTANSYLLKAH